MGLPDLAAVLWRQRELLERLTYKLECEQLLLAGGRTRWLATVTGEIETSLAELGVVELQRAAMADVVCSELGLPLGSTLETIAAGAQPPWTDVMLEHRAALRDLMSELTALAQSTQALTAAGLKAVEATLAQLGLRAAGTPVAYDAQGRRPVSGGPALIDRSL